MGFFNYPHILIYILLLILVPCGCEEPDLHSILKNIEAGNREKVGEIIGKNPDLLNNYTDDGLSLLHYAVKAGQEEIVEFFIQSGIPVDIPDSEGYTPLFTSLNEKNTQITELLLKKGASVTFKYKKLLSPLLYASGKGNVIGAALLLKYGADVNERFDHNSVVTHPLGIAVENGNISLATLFLDNGAKADAYLSDKETPLYRAVGNGNIDLVSLLVSRGADVNAKNKGYDTTALLLAAELGYNDIIFYLVENGAGISQANRYSKTPLYVAAGKDRMETVNLLVSLGVSGDDISFSLCSAAGSANYDIFMYLISIGADIHYKDPDGATALFYVAENDAIKICQYLIENGAEINYRTSFEKQTPLIQAVSHDRIVITRMLLENGARVGIKDYYGKTALGYATSPVIKRLLEKYLL